jgi:hypothetical protein
MCLIKIGEASNKNPFLKVRNENFQIVMRMVEKNQLRIPIIIWNQS